MTTVARRRDWLWPAVAIVYTVLVFVGGTMPGGPPKPDGHDKVLHALAFGGQFFVFAGAGRVLGLGAPRSVPIAAALALASGAALEIWQAFLPYRTAEWMDFVADGVGVGLAVALWSVIARRFGRVVFR